MEDFITLVKNMVKPQFKEGMIITPSCTLNLNLPVSIDGNYLFLKDPEGLFSSFVGIPIFIYTNSVLYLTHCSEVRQDGNLIFLIREKIGK